MLESQVTRTPARHEPMVLAAFSYRYDAHLVPDLLQNVLPSVHGYVAWNDTNADVALSPETERRAAILTEARRLGANWILAVDPDERFEDQLVQRMPEMLALGEDSIWMFPIREIFTEGYYRTDGIWGGKQHMRLFPMSAVQGDLTLALHGRWIADSSGFKHRDAKINIYHLRMASPVRRRLRRELYSAADPSRVYQVVGYDYLDDERGIRLERIPEGRGFSPPFVEDHGAWSPVPEDIGKIVPDTLEQRLHFAAQSTQRQGHAAAFHVLSDLATASPQDEDLPLIAASHAVTAGLFDQAHSLAQAALDKSPGDLFARLTALRARLFSGEPGLAAQMAESLPSLGPVTDHYRAEAQRPHADFSEPDALWRRWITGPATCQEGRNLVTSDLAVIVIGFRAQSGLRKAVASLVAQSEAAEITVVNSGGGDVRGALSPYLDAIRLIEVEEPLFVGAARNIGTDATRAAHVAFLAADCVAEPGWVAGRLRHHREGALSVATPVLPEPDAGIVAEGASRLLFWTRRPDTPIAWVASFGRSYSRCLLETTGPFVPGVRVSEDDRLNRLADRISPFVWAPDVLTRHSDPRNLLALWRNQMRRGENRAEGSPFRPMATLSDRSQRLAAEMRSRLRASLTSLERDRRLGTWRRWALTAVQWLANRADRIGIARGLDRIARAEALFRDGADLQTLRQAAAMDPQDWRKANRLALALSRAKDDAAIPEFLRGLWLAPGETAPIEGLVRHLLRKGAVKDALFQAERAALAAPWSRKHWEIAAGLATDAGLPSVALAHARTALALAPQLPAAHRRVADCHRLSGNHVAALFRDHCASRLENDQEARKQATSKAT